MKAVQTQILMMNGSDKKSNKKKKNGVGTWKDKKWKYIRGFLWKIYYSHSLKNI